MSTSPWLTLIAPDIGTALSRGTPSATLARLAGRGSVAQRWERSDIQSPLRPWQRGLLNTLGIEAGSLASAALSMSGHEGYWLHAEPVHFVAGLDRLSFLSLAGESKVTDAERSALFEQLAPSFASGDHVLQAMGSEWFLRSSRALQVTTSTPDAAAASELQTVMPRGQDAAELRRVMTELQMLLHEHPVNDARARRGLPAVNAVWLWGGGSPGAIEAGDFPAAFGDHAFLRGLYRHVGRVITALPENPEALLHSIAGKPRAIVVVPGADLEAMDSGWLVPLSAALADGRLSRLDLILDEWHIDVRRGDLRRFWRRALPPSQWGQRI
ncbi:MAG TPA: hypothetical protein PKE27_09750 [Povalibacter sp.]|uniref:hypothetical protein n=1 Tax=Povalibacter sp. TaxID=1962978 RepID=UPI002C98ED6D|nr:hypothetical protein [Povalibacter sp.]HMN44846.1 hypothetical protein [Povalibacter sp.]